MKNAYLKGLQQFEIKEFDFKLLFGSSISFNFYFNELVIEGNHSTKANLAILPISGEGPIKMVFKNVQVRGIFEMDTLDGGYLNLKQIVFSTKLESCDVTIAGFGRFLDGTISALLSNALPTLINESSDGINNAINERFLPKANEFLNQYRLIDLLLAIIRQI